MNSENKKVGLFKFDPTLTYFHMRSLLWESIVGLVGEEFFSALESFRDTYISELHTAEFWRDESKVISKISYVFDFDKITHLSPAVYSVLFRPILNYTTLENLHKVCKFENMRPIQRQTLEFELSQNRCKSDLDYLCRSTHISI